MKSFYKPISKFPIAKRDLSIEVKKGLRYKEIEESIWRSGRPYLKSVRLFDIYPKDKLGLDDRSMAFSLTFGADDKTLTNEIVNEQVDNIVTNLRNQLGVNLRGQQS